MADSKSHNRKLNYLRDLKDYKVAKNDPDVRGWEVHDSNHQSVGTVSGLVVDVAREKVRYIDVDIDESILPGDHDPFSAEHEDGIHEYQDSKGSIHMIIPIGVARIDADQKKVIADGIDQNSLRNIPTYRYRENTPVHSDYEQSVLANFRERDRRESESRRRENENRNRDVENRNRDFENRDLDYENRNRDVENRDLDYENRNRDFENRNRDYETRDETLNRDVENRDEIRNRDYENRDETRNRDYETRNENRNRNENYDDDDLYNSEHFNEDRFYGRDRK